MINHNMKWAGRQASSPLPVSEANNYHRQLDPKKTTILNY